MSGTGLAGEAVYVRLARRVVLAPPFRMRFRGHLGEGGSFGVSSNHGQVLRDGDFGRRVSQTVVSAEACDRSRL